MKLSSFVQLDTPMEAAVITQTLREVDSEFSIKFNQTMIALPDLFASHLWRRITKEYINPLDHRHTLYNYSKGIS